MRRGGTKRSHPFSSGVIRLIVLTVLAAQLLMARGVPRAVVRATILYSAGANGWCSGDCNGKVNAHRALKSSLLNGVFGYWTGSTPVGWGIPASFSCLNATISSSTQNSGPSLGAQKSLKLKCPSGSGTTWVWQGDRDVTGGWPYRVRAMARVDTGTWAGNVAMRVVFLQKRVNGQSVSWIPVHGCVQSGDQVVDPASQQVVSLDQNWKLWQFNCIAPAAKSGWMRARVYFGVHNNSTGYFDDVGLYARLRHSN